MRPDLVVGPFEVSVGRVRGGWSWRAYVVSRHGSARMCIDSGEVHGDQTPRRSLALAAARAAIEKWTRQTWGAVFAPAATLAASHVNLSGSQKRELLKLKAAHDAGAGAGWVDGRSARILLKRRLVVQLERGHSQAKQLGLPMAYRLTDDGFAVAGLVALEGVPHG